MILTWFGTNLIKPQSSLILIEKSMLLFFDQGCGTFGTGFHYVTDQLKKKWMTLFMKDVGWFGTTTFLKLWSLKIVLIGYNCCCHEKLQILLSWSPCELTVTFMWQWQWFRWVLKWRGKKCHGTFGPSEIFNSLPLFISLFVCPWCGRGSNFQEKSHCREMPGLLWWGTMAWRLRQPPTASLEFWSQVGFYTSSTVHCCISAPLHLHTIRGIKWYGGLASTVLSIWGFHQIGSFWHHRTLKVHTIFLVGATIKTKPVLEGSFGVL